MKIFLVMILTFTINTNTNVICKNVIKDVQHYNILEVDGGDRSGIRQSNVIVDIGYGNRVYLAYTNEYGQLIKVVAKDIVLQDENNEKILSNGRYYYDEANVLGTESRKFDQGHIIADSLGGVSNAYNITPQYYKLNRYGEQAKMEKLIREHNGCQNFVATIHYPNNITMTPSHYHYEFEISGDKFICNFNNTYKR